MGLTNDDIKGFGADAKRQITAQLLKQGKKVEKPSKMHNIVDYRGNIKFDSRKEARKFDELMLLLQAGEIRDLKLQPEFTLREAFTKPENGERVRAIRYRADFSYERRTAPDTYGYSLWVPVVLDTKGHRTSDYKIKRKMFREVMGFDITEC